MAGLGLSSISKYDTKTADSKTADSFRNKVSGCLNEWISRSQSRSHANIQENGSFAFGDIN